MIVRPSRRQIVVLVVAILSLLATYTVSAQDEEPSPIELAINIPQQVGPGQVLDVVIDYNAVDLNAGAILNYNLSGPGRIWTRSPEPPNPIANTWGPKFDPIQGTIKIQVRADDNADGQVLKHEIEVKWGYKYKKYIIETKIKYVPPTPTPTSTPRPRPVPTKPAPAPTKPVLNLTEVRFVDAENSATLVQEAQANQSIGLVVEYASSADLDDVEVYVRFEPDLVNMEGMEIADEGGYVLLISSLPAAPDGAALPGSPLTGQIRADPDRGVQYELRAFVEARVAEGATLNVPTAVETEPLDVLQTSLVALRTSVDSSIVKTGGSIIVHAFCDNLGQVTVRDVRLRIEGLPDGFAILPGEQYIDSVPASGGTVERVFTIKSPTESEGKVSFKVVASINNGESTIESKSESVQLNKPVPLAIDATSDRSAVRGGGKVYLNATCSNEGEFVAPQVTVRLIDTTGNLGVLLQAVGDIAPGESREAVFVIEIPEDFPADVDSSLVVQALSADGTVSEAQAIPLTVACVPTFELVVQPPTGTFRGPHTAESIVILRNTSQCTAREVAVQVNDLPDGIETSATQQIATLGPGESRHLSFRLEIPDGYPQSQVGFTVSASESLGTETVSPSMTFEVGGVSTLFTVVFGLLSVVAIGAIVFGFAAYLRRR